MHYRYANYHLEGYTCSSFDCNLGVVKWSYIIFDPEDASPGLQAEVTSLSQQLGLYDHRRAVMTAENVILKQKLATLGQTQRLKEGEYVFCIFYSAVSWQLVACRKVLGFRSSIHTQALLLALEADFPVDFITWLLNEGFGFWDSSLMHKCESHEALSHCLRMCLFCLQLTVKPWWRRWRDYQTNINSSCHLSIHQVLIFHKRSSASGIWGPSSSIHLFLQQAMNF